jgi:hypothetical protein
MAAQPASGSGGSARLAITRCICGGRWSSRKPIPSCMSRVDDVVVVEHQHDIVRDGAEIVKQGDEARLARRLGAAGARARLYHPWAPPY